MISLYCVLITAQNLTHRFQLDNLRNETSHAFQDAKNLKVKWKELELEQLEVEKVKTLLFLE